MKLSKERMDKLNQSLNEGAKNMETINYNNFYLTGITEELYTSEELFGMSTVNWTIFMWYLIYNPLEFDSSMNHEFYDG